MPHWLEQLIYPINKADLDILRFAHFVALAVIAVRFVPAGSPGPDLALAVADDSLRAKFAGDILSRA